MAQLTQIEIDGLEEFYWIDSTVVAPTNIRCDGDGIATTFAKIPVGETSGISVAHVRHRQSKCVFIRDNDSVCACAHMWECVCMWTSHIQSNQVFVSSIDRTDTMLETSFPSVRQRSSVATAARTSRWNMMITI